MKGLAIVAIVGSLCISSAVSAQSPAEPGKTGLKTGTTAPAISLKDQTGTVRSLDELRKGGDFLALVFYRSASW